MLKKIQPMTRHRLQKILLFLIHEGFVILASLLVFKKTTTPDVFFLFLSVYQFTYLYMAKLFLGHGELANDWIATREQVVFPIATTVALLFFLCLFIFMPIPDSNITLVIFLFSFILAVWISMLCSVFRRY